MTPRSQLSAPRGIAYGLALSIAFWAALYVIVGAAYG